jgi:L-rhamnose mutarotase
MTVINLSAIREQREAEINDAEEAEYNAERDAVQLNLLQAMVESGLSDHAIVAETLHVLMLLLIKSTKSEAKAKAMISGQLGVM